MTRTLTLGSFDLFHAGHVNLLRECANLGEVVVGLNTDEFVTAYKGRAPAVSFKQRAAVLEACKYVSRVLPNDSHDSRPLVEAVAPKYLVIGSDWAGRDYHTQIGCSQPWLDARGVILCYAPYMASVSTTTIRDKVVMEFLEPLSKLAA